MATKSQSIIRMEFDTKRIDLVERCSANFEDAFVEERRILLRKYFSYWKRKIKIKKEKAEVVQMKVEQREKLDSLLKMLRKRKKEMEFNEPTEVEDKRVIRALPEVASYKNRFKAQKSIIEQLTVKLGQKDKLIEELQLGILREDALKSLDNTKYEIREIFRNCSAKVRCKLAPPPDYVRKFMVSTQKAPKIMQQMEQRAMERAKNREIILERKRIIEENRKRMLEEALEKKRIQDEEETRRNLEMMKERRKKELELEKIRQANKSIFLEKLERAIKFHNRKLLKKSFANLLKNYKENKSNYLKSELHYNKYILSKSFKKWENLIEAKYEVKYQIADAVFAKNVLARTFKIWHEARIESIRAMQVAEDFYDFRLQSNTFVHWHRYVCIQIVERERKMKLAQKHYNRGILFNYFYQWRSLPAVMQLEKAKEEKKKKWREKVWEILPDYKPPIDDYC